MVYCYAQQSIYDNKCIENLWTYNPHPLTNLKHNGNHLHILKNNFISSVTRTNAYIEKTSLYEKYDQTGLLLSLTNSVPDLHASGFGDRLMSMQQTGMYVRQCEKGKAGLEHNSPPTTHTYIPPPPTQKNVSNHVFFNCSWLYFEHVNYNEEGTVYLGYGLETKTNLPDEYCNTVSDSAALMVSECKLLQSLPTFLFMNDLLPA